MTSMRKLDGLVHELAKALVQSDIERGKNLLGAGRLACKR